MNDRNKLLAACKKAGVYSVGGGGHHDHSLICMLTTTADVTKVEYFPKFVVSMADIPAMARSEISYTNCLEWNFKLRKKVDSSDVMVITVVVWNGDQSGYAVDKRCEYEMILSFDNEMHVDLFDQLILPCLHLHMKHAAVIQHDKNEEQRIAAVTDQIYNSYFS